MRVILQDAKYVTDAFKGQAHIVLADLRGMGVVTEETGRIMGDVMRYGREHGTYCCVHLSDSSIFRLQTSRLAREVSPEDKVTVNVVSLDEAERVIVEKLAQIRSKK
jgi:hypothetical protein